MLKTFPNHLNRLVITVITAFFSVSLAGPNSFAQVKQPNRASVPAPNPNLASASKPQTQAQYEKVTGSPVIEDGDTLVFDGRKINLEAIDAPELGQKCFTRKIDKRRWDKASSVDGGAKAKRHLVQLIGNATVTCSLRHRANVQYHQVTWGVCSTPQHQSLSEEMLKSGWVFPESDYSFQVRRRTMDQLILVAVTNKRGMMGGKTSYDTGCIHPYNERRAKGIDQP